MKNIILLKRLNSSFLFNFKKKIVGREKQTYFEELKFY